MADGFYGNLRFGPFELSSRERVLRRDGVMMLPLGGRARLLVRRHHRPSRRQCGEQEPSTSDQGATNADLQFGPYELLRE